MEEAAAEEESVDLEERREAGGGATEEGEADPLFAAPEAIGEGSYSSGGEGRGGGGRRHGRRLSCRRGSTFVGKREREYLKRNVKLPNCPSRGKEKKKNFEDSNAMESDL